MSNKALSILLLVFVTVNSIKVKAQNWKVRNYSIGYRIFEINSIDNNPFSIAKLLKDPLTYQNYLSNIRYNSFYGNPQVVQLHTGYINIEWFKDASLSRFWKKYTIQTGLLATGGITRGAGAIGEENFNPADTSAEINMYSLTRKQQFFGLNAGLNRRFNISKKLRFFTGFHTQGSFSLVHYYKQQWDSSTYTPATGRKTGTTKLPDLKGRNYFQWQLMIPLGLEYELYKKRFFIRVEVDAGIAANRYVARGFANREAHGAGVWLIYQRK